MGAQWYEACNGTELWLVTDDGRLLTTSIPGMFPVGMRITIGRKDNG